MGATVGQLNIEVVMALNKLQGQFTDLQQKVQANNAKLNSEFSKMASFARAQFMSIVPAVSIGAIAGFTKSLLDNAGQIADAASAARMGAEEFQVLAAYAGDSGIGVDKLTTALAKMEDAIEQARAGNETAQKSFQTLGLNFNELAKLSPERQLEAIGRAIAGAGNDSAAFSAAIDILGAKNAPKLLESLQRLGTEGFNKLSEDANAAGQVMDKYVVAALDRAGDAWVRYWRSVKNDASKMVATALNENTSEGLKFQVDQTKKALAGIKDESVWSWLLAPDGREIGLNLRLKALEEQLQKVTAAEDEAAKKAAELLSKNPVIPMGPSLVLSDKDTEKERGAKIKGYTEALAEQEKAFDNLVDKQKKSNDETDRTNKTSEDLAQHYREMANPFLVYTKQLAEVDKLWKDGRLDAEAHAGAIDSINQAIANSNLDAYDKTWGQFFDFPKEKVKEAVDSAKVFQSEMNQMWNSVSDRAGQAFADMVLAGKASFSDLTNMIARTMIEIAARMAIINPIMNVVFGLTGAAALPAFFGAGARASGGPVSAGAAYLVGEKGPETFVPASAGTIIPNRALGSSGGTFGQSVTVVYNIQSGVTRNELAPLLDMHAQRVKGEISNAILRGGGPAAAFGR